MRGVVQAAGALALLIFFKRSSKTYERSFGTFFRDVDDIVKNFLARRLGAIEPRVWPIFERVNYGGGDEKYMKPTIIKAAIALASDIAELTGLF
ncbi:uncharacterized protein DFL_006519 [Arthrobotrys flagrans]|uniref:Uncharacterized protein n=1 Tax=Arthrobotrys flagrans TaxID=97331 RepID=A0A437A180_ARTFL|nr:hypothetical protein DFL_006519 [Arthrobotrys flagrans]